MCVLDLPGFLTTTGTAVSPQSAALNQQPPRSDFDQSLISPQSALDQPSIRPRSALGQPLLLASRWDGCGLDLIVVGQGCVGLRTMVEVQ